MAPSSSTLEKTGIKIETNPSDITALSPCAEELRQLLLNFTEIVPHSQKATLETFYEKDKHHLRKAFRIRKDDNIYCDSEHRAYHARWEAASALRDKAMNLPDRNREATWNGLLTNFVFQDINDQASADGIHLRDLLCWGSDELLTNAVNIRGQLDDDKDHLPKPDFWFGLGLYNRKQLSRLKGLERSDKSTEYFIPENLKIMNQSCEEELIYQPVRSRAHAAFPWMVVDLKKEWAPPADRDECLKQAANASYTCLRLCEWLAKRAGKKPSPIVAFTSIGPKVKIFIAYKSEDDDGDDIYRMSCIWYGHMENIWHAVQLRRIMDQVKYWALRIFKPWVTECLERWYEEETDDEADDESEDELGVDTEDESD